MQTRYVYNYIVNFDEKNPLLEKGIYYLTVLLNQEEAKVFFEYAFRHGTVLFEDNYDRKFHLTHNQGKYELTPAS